jgi:hypothetical protein
VDDTLVNGVDYVTSYGENIPTRNPSGGLTFWDNWSVGYMPRANMTYTAFDKIESVEDGERWISSSKVSNVGAATAGMEYRFRLYTTSYNVAIRYTVQEDATIALSLAHMFAPERKTSAIGVYGEALFAIFVGDEMIWPTAGGSYGNDDHWRIIDSETTQGQINREIDKLRLALSEGDEIYFVAKRPAGGASSLFGCVPNVYYLK